MASESRNNKKRNPNPQGKGLVPILAGLQQHMLRLQVPPKPITQIEMELFTSLFVLQSEIRFNPAVGQVYWLYSRAEGYRLSLIGPDEWHREMPHRFIGRCELLEDRTWTLELADEVARDDAFLAHIERQRAVFQAAMERAGRVEDVLPTYVPSLGYQSRVFAYILGRSLRRSMQLSGIAALPYREAVALLPAPE
jgi:hypothetical protein